jgi:signal transduction histidine kinase
VYEGTLVDLTDRKQADEARALRSVAELANAAAHEINNPVAIAGHLELLEAKSPEQGAAIGAARTAAERIRDIVARLARITRLERATEWPSDLPPMLDLRRSGAAESIPPVDRRSGTE